MTMTPTLLYSLLPTGSFDIEFVFNQIMDYSPHQRFPKPKYEYWEVLSSWYVLIKSNKVEILPKGTATKI